MSRVIARRGAWLVFAALVLLCAVFEIWNVTPSANATSNRRICSYVEDFPADVTVPVVKGKDTTYYTLSANVYVGINYKKDGDCPEIEDPYDINGDRNNTARLTYRQPVPKDQCEDWFRTIGATGHYLGTLRKDDPYLNIPADTHQYVDPCDQANGGMVVDTLYEFYVVTQTISFVDGTKFNKGDVVSNKRTGGIIR